MKRFLFFLILILLAWLLARSPQHQQRWSVQVQAPPTVEVPRPRPPAEPDGFAQMSTRDRFRLGSTLLIAEGEASPGLVHCYDTAILEPRSWDESRLGIVHKTGTLAMARISLTRIEAREPLFAKIPASLRSRAEGPGPTLVMEFEDLWFEMLRHEKIKPVLEQGFDGVVFTDLDGVDVDSGAWTMVRLFLVDLKTRFPGNLFLIQCSPEIAAILSPLADGLLFIGFNHARIQVPELIPQLQQLGLSRILTLDFQDLQFAGKVRENWETSFRAGFLPAVQQSLKSQATSSQIPPESGKGFLVAAWSDDVPPPVLAGVRAEKLSGGLIRYNELPAGFYNLSVAGKSIPVGVVPGRTSYLNAE